MSDTRLHMGRNGYFNFASTTAAGLDYNLQHTHPWARNILIEDSPARAHNLLDHMRCTHNAPENEGNREDGKKTSTKGGWDERRLCVLLNQLLQGTQTKQSVPLHYLKVPALAFFVVHRSLFSGFYKAVVPALKGMMKRGQLLYLIAFSSEIPMLSPGADIITDLDQVHPVGVFAQITSTFAVKNTEGEDEEGLMDVLYPHWRISITELVRAAFSPTSPLQKFIISIVNIKNPKAQPYNKDNQYQTNTLAPSCQLVFKDIQLDSLFQGRQPDRQAPTRVLPDGAAEEYREDGERYWVGGCSEEFVWGFEDKSGAGWAEEGFRCGIGVSCERRMIPTACTYRISKLHSADMHSRSRNTIGENTSPGASVSGSADVLRRNSSEDLKIPVG
ncbi:hypothetical protein BDQ17DRAFT_1415230 [Cyathus striatus]|nr:hypothetical protein BDQ17DRAFT_1415230 [Cyathus striatus]